MANEEIVKNVEEVIENRYQIMRIVTRNTSDNRGSKELFEMTEVICEFVRENALEVISYSDELGDIPIKTINEVIENIKNRHAYYIGNRTLKMETFRTLIGTKLDYDNVIHVRYIVELVGEGFIDENDDDEWM